MKIFNPGHGAVTVPSKDVPNVAEDGEDGAQKNVFVWYACYGSNLSEERFNCYLRGGRVEGMSRPCVGARDATPARASVVKWMLNRVFFAYAGESAWGYGGGAMLDIRQSQTYKSCLRLYKVTLQQFNDVIAQENNLAPPLPAANWLTCGELVQLRQQPHGSLQRKFEDAIYPAVAYLGEHDDAAIVTFTCLTDMANAFLSGELPTAPPANTYLTVLRRGLQELGLNEEEAIRYWKDIIARQFCKDTSVSLNKIA